MGQGSGITSGDAPRGRRKRAPLVGLLAIVALVIMLVILEATSRPSVEPDPAWAFDSAQTTDAASPSPSPVLSLTPESVGIATVWFLSDVGTMPSMQWIVDDAFLLAVPIDQSAEFFDAVLGERDKSQDQPMYHGARVPESAFGFGELVPQGADGTFELDLPHGDHVLCIGVVERTQMSAKTCQVGTVDGGDLSFSSIRGAWNLSQDE